MVEITRNGDTMTALLSGKIDHHSAADMRVAIDGQTQRHKPKMLQLDFSGVKFMDSSGIGLVMGRYRNIQLIGGKLRVINIPDNLRKMFEISGLSCLGII